MDSLEHSVPFTDVRTACRAYAALKFSRLVGDDIAVEIGKNEYLEVLATLRVDELCGSDVDIPFVGCDLRIVLADIFAKVEELTVGGLDYVSLCDDGNSFLMISSCIVVCKLCNSLTAFGRCYNEVNRKIVGYVDAL